MNDTVSTLIQGIRARGIKIWAEGDALRLTIPEGRELSKSDRAALLANKSDALKILHAEAWGDNNQRVNAAFAAIMRAAETYAALYADPRYHEGAGALERVQLRDELRASINDLAQSLPDHDTASYEQAVERITSGCAAIQTRITGGTPQRAD